MGVVVLAVLLRLLPHIPNFAPISALALFGGVYLGKRYALVLPLLVMIISDYLLLYINPFGTPFFTGNHLYAPQAAMNNTTLAVYGSFLLSGFVGLWLRNHKSPQTIFLAATFSSIQFFLITNAAVWLAGAYDRSIAGLWESYIAGIPFFRGTLFGDLFYTGAFFGGYELLHYISHSKKVTMTA